MRYWRHSALFALAAVGRLAFALITQIDMRDRFRFDPSMYDLIAQNIARGVGYAFIGPEPAACFPPGWPAVLAAAYWIAGPSLYVAWVLNAMIGGATAVLTYALGRRLIGERAGLLAGVIFALTPGDIFYSAVTMSEPLFGLGLAAFLLLLVSAPQRTVAVGVALGLLALVRGTGLFVGLVPFGFWWRRYGLAVALRRSAVAFCIMLATVSPWLARNYYHHGAFPLLSTDGPWAFFNSHNPLANGSQHFGLVKLRETLWPDIMADPVFARRDARLAQVHVPYAIGYMAKNPGAELAQAPMRLLNLIRHGHEGFSFAAGGRTYVSPAVHRTITGVADVWWWTLLALAACGLILWPWRRNRDVIVLPLAVGVVVMLHSLLFFGDPRFHAPLIPVLCLFAGHAIASATARH